MEGGSCREEEEYQQTEPDSEVVSVSNSVSAERMLCLFPRKAHGSVPGTWCRVPGSAESSSHQENQERAKALASAHRWANFMGIMISILCVYAGFILDSLSHIGLLPQIEKQDIK